MAGLADKSELRSHVAAFAQDVERYLAASAQIRSRLEAEELADIMRALEGEAFELNLLTTRQRQRISRLLGREIRARIEADCEDPRAAFSLETYTQTVLPHEDVIEEARTAAHDFILALDAEQDTGILARKAHDFVEQAAPGYQALAPQLNHQAFVDQLFAALAAQSTDLKATDRERINQILHLRRDQAVLLGSAVEPRWQDLMRGLRQISAGPGPNGNGAEHRAGNASRHQLEQSEDQSMAQNGDNLQTNRLVDAVSRLQEGGAAIVGGAVAGGAASADFSKTLEQQIYASIGVPSLNSDAGLTLPKGQFVDKLYLGLNRAVIREAGDLGSRFVFNPVQARAHLPMDTGAALGAQGVVAETVVTLKPAIIRCLRVLRAEACHCSEHEVDDLVSDIELGLDLIARESRSASGIFRVWAATLIRRVVSDIVALIKIYGIRLDIPKSAARLIEKRLDDDDLFKDAHLHQKPVLIDRDIGFLAREANDQAIRTIFEHIATIAQLIQDLDTMPRGPLTVRLRAVMEAIPPAVADARAALNLAGVSEIDRAAEFLPDAEDPSGIELARLLDLTEAAANEWRVRLLDENLNKRDLRWLQQTLKTLSKAFHGADVEGDTDGKVRAPTINRNRYALGARQLRELADHVHTARRLAKRLVHLHQGHDGQGDHHALPQASQG